MAVGVVWVRNAASSSVPGSILIRCFDTWGSENGWKAVRGLARVVPGEIVHAGGRLGKESSVRNIHRSGVRSSIAVRSEERTMLMVPIETIPRRVTLHN